MLRRRREALPGPPGLLSMTKMCTPLMPDWTLRPKKPNCHAERSGEESEANLTAKSKHPYPLPKSIHERSISNSAPIPKTLASCDIRPCYPQANHETVNIAPPNWHQPAPPSP